MRERQVRHLVTGGTFNAKYSPGGLVDIEYLIQGLQINHVALNPAMRVTNLRDGRGSSRGGARVWRARGPAGGPTGRLPHTSALPLHEITVFPDEQVEMVALLGRELEEDLLALGVLEALAVALEELVRVALAADADEQRAQVVPDVEEMNRHAHSAHSRAVAGAGEDPSPLEKGAKRLIGGGPVAERERDDSGAGGLFAGRPDLRAPRRDHVAAVAGRRAQRDERQIEPVIQHGRAPSPYL